MTPNRKWLRIDWKGFGSTQPPDDVFAMAARMCRRLLAVWDEFTTPKDRP